MKTKAYRVPLYEVGYNNLSLGKLTFIDYIIVKKNFSTIHEIITDYDEIDIIHHYFLKHGNLDFVSRKPIKAKEIGHHLVVFTEDLIEDNRIREEDIEKYVSEYETSRWNQIYQDLHILTKEEKKDIKKREYSRF
ncbi:MAG: hypothetical protein IJG68_01020 [Bacilli bacterium]|nr:hypothetical protein [Bacilli bacterium]